MTIKAHAAESAQNRLAMLRKAIDACDESILSLLQHRSEAVEGVLEAKRGGVVFRPGREAQIYRRLLSRQKELRQGRVAGMAPANLLGLWRHIIAASLRQQNIEKFYFCAPKHEARFLPAASDYSGGLALHAVPEIEVLLAILAQEKQALALVPAPTEDSAFWRDGWWLRLPEGVEIAARWPFLPQPQFPPVWILSTGGSESSGNDMHLAAGAAASVSAAGGKKITEAEGQVLAGFTETPPAALRFLGRIGLTEGEVL